MDPEGAVKPYLELPHKPGEKAGESDEELMRSIRAVVEYTGLDMWQAMELPCDMFMLCYKNWTIDRLRQTPEGREYLDDCDRLKQTKLDKAGLRRLAQRLGG